MKRSFKKHHQGWMLRANKAINGGKACVQTNVILNAGNIFDFQNGVYMTGNAVINVFVKKSRQHTHTIALGEL